MASPFPGMDPYLERPDLWPAVRHQLIAALYQLLLPGLVDRYRARVGTREYVAETPLFTSIIQERHSEEFLEIRARSDGRLVTQVEVLGLTNKLHPAGRAAYLAARLEARRQRASVVEVDLLTQGRSPTDFPRDGLPPADYAVTVTRGSAPDRHEVVGATLPRRLPKFKLPLAADDRDTVLDLQVVFARAYTQGGFAALIDYALPPPPGLAFVGDGQEWLAASVAQGGLKPPGR